MGGKWKTKSGKIAGLGLYHHYKTGISLLWPEHQWTRWNELLLKEWLAHRCIGVMGPANAGKTHDFAVFHLFDYYCFSGCTTVLVCSTTQERLEDRIWGEIKKHHKIAKAKFSWLPGNLIESRLRMVTDHRTQSTDGRDFRNGMIGVPCRKGGQYVGLGDFIGIKNKRVRLCGDELQLLPRSFIDCIPNLIKNADCKITGMGNPKETLDALGGLCEPAASVGGWDGGIDQSPKTKTWETKWPNGVCIQLCGSDSPNLDVPKDAPIPFPFLIKRKDMEDDATLWGKDDWHYTMFNEGRMPRGQGSRRVLTVQLCKKMGALNDPMWANTNQVEVAFLDAAYRAVGGDRCVFGRLKYGQESSVDPGSTLVSGLISQDENRSNFRNILALLELTTIPITSSVAGVVSPVDEPEEQIVSYVQRECTQHGIKPNHFFFDSGMRTSLVSAFARIWSPDVVPIDCGGTPSDRKVSQNIDVKCSDYYSKYITELWYSVRLIIEAGQFRGLTQDAMQEGCAREWKLVGKNKIEVETKAEMKTKTGRSPDLFDALAIGCEGARRCGFIIAKLGNLEYEEKDHNWKRDLQEKARKVATAGTLTY